MNDEDIFEYLQKDLGMNDKWIEHINNNLAICDPSDKAYRDKVLIEAMNYYINDYISQH